MTGIRDGFHSEPFAFQQEVNGHTSNAETAAKTDAAGTFRLNDLMPGLKYTPLIGESDMNLGMRIVVRHEDLVVESGITKDLGDLKGKQTPGK